MFGCYIWMRRLNVKEIWWVTNISFWNEGIKTDPTSLMNSSRKNNEWIPEKSVDFVSKYKDKEVALFWSHHQTDRIEQDTIQRTLSGKKKRWKPITTCLGNIIQWTDMDLDRLLRATENKIQWKRTIHDVVNPRIDDDWSQSSQCSWVICYNTEQRAVCFYNMRLMLCLNVCVQWIFCICRCALLLLLQ